MPRITRTETHCANGHPWDNTEKKICRICKAAYRQNSNSRRYTRKRDRQQITASERVDAVFGAPIVEPVAVKSYASSGFFKTGIDRGEFFLKENWDELE